MNHEFTPYLIALQRLFSLGSTPHLGLHRITDLLARLGNPQKNFKAFHVAGTNGKGSVCAFLDAILGEAGICRGLYTSPHLSCARERIQIQGKLVSEGEFAALESLVFDASQGMVEQPTFFERITAMAFLAFAKTGIEIAVVEVGLGGRYDATNLVNPVVCGITPIGIDHTDFLGDSLEKIAYEKAGIIKSGIPVITSFQQPGAAIVIQKVAKELDAALLVPGQLDYLPALFGPHQMQNASVAAAMVAAGLSLPTSYVKKGLSRAQWPGRYEMVWDNPLVILDGAHNPDGLQALLQALAVDSRVMNRPLFLVNALTSGHNEEAFVQTWQRHRDWPAQIFSTRSRSARSLPAEAVAQLWNHHGCQSCVIEPSAPKALELAMAAAQKVHGVVLVAGSLYLVGEVRSRFFHVPVDPILPHY